MLSHVLLNARLSKLATTELGQPLSRLQLEDAVLLISLEQTKHQVVRIDEQYPRVYLRTRGPM